MHPTASRLPEKSRARIAAALNACLNDGVDLHTQVKVAHWNTRGPLFSSLHPLFDTFAGQLAETNDDIAERAVTLGALATGTARGAAKASRIAEYPADATDALAHASNLAERFAVYLDGLRAARAVSDDLGDLDTSDLLTGAVRAFEKNAWFLHATLDG